MPKNTIQNIITALYTVGLSMSINHGEKMKNPIVTVIRLMVNLATAWLVIEAGHSLDNIYVTLAGGALLTGWILGFIERYEV